MVGWWSDGLVGRVVRWLIGQLVGWSGYLSSHQTDYDLLIIGVKLSNYQIRGHQGLLRNDTSNEIVYLCLIALLALSVMLVSIKETKHRADLAAEHKRFLCIAGDVGNQPFT